MKYAIYHGVKDIEIKEGKLPKCGENDILIRNLRAGICGSDVQAYLRDGDSVMIFKESEFGHEMVSEVVEVGANVNEIECGQWVYPYPIFAKGDGVMRAATVGGFSEYVLVPDCRLNHSVFLLNKQTDLNVLGMVEPFTVGFHAAKRTLADENKTAVVFGAGIIGISAALGLRRQGVKKIMVVDLSDYRLNMAKALDFEVCNSANESLLEKGKIYFGVAHGMFGEVIDADVYVDAVGAKSVIETFMSVAKRCTRLSVVGVHHQPVAIDMMMLTYNEMDIVGSAGYDMEDTKNVIEYFDEATENLAMLVSHEYTLDDLADAIEKSSDVNASMKVMIKY